jgi:hypothetical protein
VPPTEMKVLSEYFNMLGSKVQAGKQMAAGPVCDMSKASLPTACESFHYDIYFKEILTTAIQLQQPFPHHLKVLS